MGMRENKIVYLKWASHLWLSIQNFIFHQSSFLVLWFGLGGWVHQINPPHTHTAVDKHIPALSMQPLSMQTQSIQTLSIRTLSIQI